MTRPGIAERSPLHRFPSLLGSRPRDAANDNGPGWWQSDGARLAADTLLARQCADALRSAYTVKNASHVELCSDWAHALVWGYPDKARLAWVLHDVLAALSGPV